ncbi:MAG: CBS domain-containing protein [Hyphomicrobiales bacterium]
MHARDVMTAPVVTATPDATVLEIAEKLLEHHISAVPIVNEDSAILGIVSEGDLIRRTELGSGKRRSWWLAALAGKALAAEEFIKSHGMHARDIMTQDVLVADEDTPLWEIAEQLERCRIKRLPVVKDGKLSGIVSRANLLQALTLHRPDEDAAPTLKDKEIRARIMDVLKKEAWPETSHLNLVVKDGTVYLWGTVSSELQANALRAAAESTEGVKSVVDNTAVAKVLY